jgi:WD40 repeat protein
MMGCSMKADVESRTRLLRIWLKVVVLVVVLAALSYFGVLNVLFRGGAGSGKIAKYQLTLHDDIFVTSVAWSPDGKFIAASSTQSNELHLWDVEKRQLAAAVHRTIGGAEYGELSWSPDARSLVVCDLRGEIRIYASPSLALVHAIAPLAGNGCERTAFSSDGSRLAVLGIISRSLATYSTSDWRLIKSYDLEKDWGRRNTIRSIAYVPSTHNLAAAGGAFEHRGDSNAMNGLVWIFEPEDEIPSREIPVYQYDPKLGPPAAVSALAMAPNGENFATGTTTGVGPPDRLVTAAVRVLSLRGGGILGRPLDGTTYGGPGGLQFSFDGKYLITGHDDARSKLLHVIDAITFRTIDAVPSGGIVYDVTASPHADQFAAGVDKSIIIWSLPDRR